MANASIRGVARQAELVEFDAAHRYARQQAWLVESGKAFSSILTPTGWRVARGDAHRGSRMRGRLTQHRAEVLWVFRKPPENRPFESEIFFRGFLKSCFCVPKATVGAKRVALTCGSPQRGRRRRTSGAKLEAVAGRHGWEVVQVSPTTACRARKAERTVLGLTRYSRSPPGPPGPSIAWGARCRT